MVFNKQTTATRSSASQAIIDQGLRAYMLRVYNYMGSGLFLTGIVSLIVFQAAGGYNITLSSSSGFVGVTSFGNLLFNTGLKWIVALSPLAVMFYFFSIAVLSLARWWQSCLYNPSGFGSEFHSLRLPPLVSMAAVLAVIFCLVFLDRLGVWVPFVVSPLFIAGLGLVHWTFEAAKIPSFWLIGFYMGLFLFFQLFFPVLTSIAIIDSFFDLRSRFKFSKKE